jgi:subtilisin
MAKRSRRARRTSASDETRGGGLFGPGRTDMTGKDEEVMPPGTTGRFLVLLREGATKAGIKAMKDRAGLQAESAAAFTDDTDSALPNGEEALVFEELGVAVVDTSPDQIQALSAAASEDNAILAIEPERVVYAIKTIQPGIAEPPTILPPPPPGTLGPLVHQAEYLRGYRDAVNHVANRLLASEATVGEVGEEVAPALIETEFTWGLQATKVPSSRFTGKGVRVAVLDTGLDLGHPDFRNRQIRSRSFIPNQPVQDGHGHGTHCIGTACGPRQPGQLPRYGVAFGSAIYAGKVLSNQGSGADGGILAGIEWALKNRCAVVSMSLGARVMPGQSYSRIFEQVAQRSLAAGTLIIAAAGNDSNRPGLTIPVSHPANCPSIMAVGALDPQLRVAWFSNAGLNPQGGQVDIAGPGVAVRSSWPRPTLYNTINGTSMATPHVAGIAALLAEANPKARGRGLAGLLIQTARRLQIPGRDVGAGLVQAP